MMGECKKKKKKKKKKNTLTKGLGEGRTHLETNDKILLLTDRWVQSMQKLNIYCKNVLLT